MLLGFLSVYILDSSAVFAEAYEDNGEYIEPGDTLTYRVDWDNTGEENITSLDADIPIPANTAFQAGTINTSSGATAEQTEEGYINVTVNQIEPDETGFTEFEVLVDNPNHASVISNQANYQTNELGQDTTNNVNNPLLTASISGYVRKVSETGNDTSLHLFSDDNNNQFYDEGIPNPN